MRQFRQISTTIITKKSNPPFYYHPPPHFYRLVIRGKVRKIDSQKKKKRRKKSKAVNGFARTSNHSRRFIASRDYSNGPLTEDDTSSSRRVSKSMTTLFSIFSLLSSLFSSLLPRSFQPRIPKNLSPERPRARGVVPPEK